MKDTNIKEKTRVKSEQTKTAENIRVRDEVSTGAMLATGGLGLLFGTWAVACFVGGLIAAGGPLSFVKSWFTAVTGI